MKVILSLEAGMWDRLRAHLLRPKSELEEAAFLFAKAVASEGMLQLEVLDSRMMQPSDFDEQTGNYLEIRDECKLEVIQRAHRLNACAIELHSHPGPWPAEFSPYDIKGFRETVPHMFWRLRGRPYVAIVVAHTGFDALVWTEKGRPAVALSKLVDGEVARIPTNLTLRNYGSL